VLVAGGTVCLGYTGHALFLPNWFVRRRGLAVSIAFSGVGVGAIVLLLALLFGRGRRSHFFFLLRCGQSLAGNGLASLAGLLRWRSSRGRLCRRSCGLVCFWRRGRFVLFRRLRVGPRFAFCPKSAAVGYNKF